MIYPKALILNKENKNNKKSSFLDIDMQIQNNNTLYTKIYDKRDDFNFEINNFPNLSGNVHFKRSHGIVISQLIRYSKVCVNVNDFITTCNNILLKLCNQYFNKNLLKQKCSFFYDKHYHYIQKYAISKK